MKVKVADAKWEQVAPMIEKRSSFGAAVVSNRLVVAGGSDGRSTLNSVELYDVEQYVWRKIFSMKDCRENHALVEEVDGALFAIGGKNKISKWFR